MKRINHLLYILVVCALMSFSCEKNNTETDDCYPDSRTVKVAKNVHGMISILDSKYPNVWSIKSREGIIGSQGPAYDTFDTVIPCNLPDSLKREGLHIIFSGALKDTGKDFKKSADSVYYSNVYYSRLDEIKILNVK